MDTDSYGDVIIHAGTNDCATKCPIDKIFNNFRDIPVHAKHDFRNGTVKFSNITPRDDNPVAAAMGVEVNDVIIRIAEECECIFVCHQDNFLCQNGDINEELLSVDGLHLSKLGTERLISNLKCPPQHHVVSVVPKGQVATLNDRSLGRRRPRRARRHLAPPSHAGTKTVCLHRTRPL